MFTDESHPSTPKPDIPEICRSIHCKPGQTCRLDDRSRPYCSGIYCLQCVLRLSYKFYLIPDAVRSRYCTIRYSWNIMPVRNYFLFLADLSCADLFSIVSMLLCNCYVLGHCWMCVWHHNTSHNTLWLHITFHMIYEWIAQWYSHSNISLFRKYINIQ